MIKLLDVNRVQNFYVKYANRYDEYVSVTSDVARMQNEYFTAYQTLAVTQAAILLPEASELVILYPHYQTFKDHICPALIVNAHLLPENELKYCYNMYCKALDTYVYKTKQGQNHIRTCINAGFVHAYKLKIGDDLPYLHLQMIKENQCCSKEELMNTLAYQANVRIKEGSQFKPFFKPTRLPMYADKNVR